MAQPNQYNPLFLGKATGNEGFEAWHGNGVMMTCVSTTSATPVAVFSSSATTAIGRKITITGVFAVVKDVSVATITIAGTQGTVGTLATAGTIGAMKGTAAALANTGLAATDTFTVVSTGGAAGGDAYVFFTYKMTNP